MDSARAEATYLQRLAEIPHGGVAGYFGPDSVTWRLYREPLVLLGGPRALLLQIAHPAVAQGVAHYSKFKTDALRRGLRTFAAMATIYFGDDEQARTTAVRLYRIHSGIRGRFQSGGAESEFVATQAELLLWVLATLTDTTLLMFRHAPPRGVGRDWAQRFFEESKIAARLLGIPTEIYPPDLAAFARYMADMLHADLLGSDPLSRELARDILWHRLFPSPAHPLAGAWLPGGLAERLGVNVRHAGTRAGRMLPLAIGAYRLLPPPLRYAPAYHQAMHRLSRHAGRRPSLIGSVYQSLARRFAVPLALEAPRLPGR
jgi:uncharacterized protein (DUF2236 family)